MTRALLLSAFLLVGCTKAATPETQPQQPIVDPTPDGGTGGTGGTSVTMLDDGTVIETPIEPSSVPEDGVYPYPPEWPKTGVVVLPPGVTDRAGGVFWPGEEPDPDKAPVWQAKDMPSAEVMKEVHTAIAASYRRLRREGKLHHARHYHPDAGAAGSQE